MFVLVRTSKIFFLDQYVYMCSIIRNKDCLTPNQLVKFEHSLGAAVL